VVIGKFIIIIIITIIIIIIIIIYVNKIIKKTHESRNPRVKKKFWGQRD